MQRHIGKGEPFNRREFLLIKLDASTPIDRDHVPQRNIHMRSGQSHSPGARNHQRLSDLMFGNNLEFLKELTNHGFSRVLRRLNMTTGRQPQFRASVINEKDIVSVNDGAVGDKVLRRGGRLRGTKHRRA
jgi:hypothetical protein